MLRACRGLLRAGGRTAFYTIHPAPELTARQRRRAARDGPIAVATPRPHAEMLAAAGYVDVQETDCTAEFRTVAQAWVDEFDARRDDFVALLGAAAFEQRQAERRTQLQAVEDGVLRRSLFVAVNPGSRRRRVAQSH